MTLRCVTTLHCATTLRCGARYYARARQPPAFGRLQLAGRGGLLRGRVVGDLLLATYISNNNHRQTTAAAAAAEKIQYHGVYTWLT